MVFIDLLKPSIIILSSREFKFQQMTRETEFGRLESCFFDEPSLCGQSHEGLSRRKILKFANAKKEVRGRERKEVNRTSL